MRCTGSTPRPRSIRATPPTWRSSDRRTTDQRSGRDSRNRLPLTAPSQLYHHAVDRIQHDPAAFGVVIGLNGKSQGLPATQLDIAGKRLDAGNAPGLRAHPPVQRSVQKTVAE